MIVREPGVAGREIENEDYYTEQTENGAEIGADNWCEKRRAGTARGEHQAMPSAEGEPAERRYCLNEIALRQAAGKVGQTPCQKK
jgi:hypothetical protein